MTKREVMKKMRSLMEKIDDLRSVAEELGDYIYDTSCDL